MDRIAESFRNDFSKWGLMLPARTMQRLRGGVIREEGWLIQYAYGRNSLGAFLDYYVHHRMTNDRHVRLYESGRRQYLAAMTDMFISSADPREATRLEAAHRRRNRRVARMLVAKVLGVSFKIPRRAAVNSQVQQRSFENDSHAIQP